MVLAGSPSPDPVSPGPAEGKLLAYAVVHDSDQLPVRDSVIVTNRTATPLTLNLGVVGVTKKAAGGYDLGAAGTGLAGHVRLDRTSVRLPAHGIVLLRMNPADSAAKLARLRELLIQDASRLPQFFVVVDESKARFRALPTRWRFARPAPSEPGHPAGAQTERRGRAGPVRVLLGGETHRPTS